MSATEKCRLLTEWSLPIGPGYDAPYSAAYVICNEQTALFIDRNTHGSTLSLAVPVEKSGQDIYGQPGWTSIGKGNENDLVATGGIAVP